MMISINRFFRRHLSRFAADRRGVSAIEFAMLLPLMITLYLGTVEVSQGIAIQRKVTLTARTVADLVSQVSAINNANMTNVLQASTAVFSPYSTSTAGVTVSLISVDGNSKATVTWSDTLNGTAKTVGSVVTLPGALLIPNSSLVLGEVSYGFTPTIGYVISGTLTLKDQIYMRPRISSTIARTAN